MGGGEVGGGEVGGGEVGGGEVDFGHVHVCAHLTRFREVREGTFHGSPY